MFCIFAKLIVLLLDIDVRFKLKDLAFLICLHFYYIVMFHSYIFSVAIETY